MNVRQLLDGIAYTKKHLNGSDEDEIVIDIFGIININTFREENYVTVYIDENGLLQEDCTNGDTYQCKA